MDVAVARATVKRFARARRDDSVAFDGTAPLPLRRFFDGRSLSTWLGCLVMASAADPRRPPEPPVEEPHPTEPPAGDPPPEEPPVRDPPPRSPPREDPPPEDPPREDPPPEEPPARTPHT